MIDPVLIRNAFRGRVQRRSRGRGVVAGGTGAPPRGVRLRGSGSADAEAAREGGSAGGRAVVGGDQGGGSGGARRSEPCALPTRL